MYFSDVSMTLYVLIVLMKKCNNICYYSLHELTFYRSKLTIDEIISDHRHKIDNHRIWRITVRRQNVFEDTLRAMKGCVDSEAKCLDVRFLGEPAIDEGGPTREFLRLLMRSIDTNRLYLDGAPNHRVPRHNVIAVQVLLIIK